MAWSWSKEATDALNNWFTPSMPAVKNYVGRGNLDRTIMREFAQRGRQVLVYGPTGAGKTSMVLDNLKKLEKSHGTKSIRVTMSDTTTIESFVADVAGRLHLSRVVQRIQTNEDGIQAEAKAGLRWFSLRAEVQNQSTNQNITEQYMGNDDFAILEEVLFKRNTVLIVDDMENLPGKADSLRVRLAEIAKNMSDDAVNYEKSYAKIVFVGIAETAKELWHDVQSLRSRLATIAVPYLNEVESKKIIKTGWDNAKLKSSEQQIDRTIYISTGIGKVLHELGRNAGYAAIYEGSQTMKDEYIADAIQEVFAVNELEYRSRLDKAKNKTSTKTTVRNYVLYAMANSEKNTMTTQGILSAVNDLREGKEMSSSSLSPVLTKLKGPDLDILTSDDRNYWHFSDPMFKAYVREHKDELLLKKTEG